MSERVSKRAATEAVPGKVPGPLSVASRAAGLPGRHPCAAAGMPKVVVTGTWRDGVERARQFMAGVSRRLAPHAEHRLLRRDRRRPVPDPPGLPAPTVNARAGRRRAARWRSEEAGQASPAQRREERNRAVPVRAMALKAVLPRIDPESCKVRKGAPARHRPGGLVHPGRRVSAVLFATLLGTLCLLHVASAAAQQPTGLALSADGGAAEGREAVTLTVTLNAPAPQGGTTVTLTTGGTATRGVDYTIAPTAFTIDEGQTTGTAAVMIVDDEESDDGETIHIYATSTNPVLTGTAAGYSLGLTIADNDGGGSGTSDGGAGATAPALPTLPALSITDAKAVEGETVRFRVTLDRASRRTVTADYRTRQGTAAAGDDFTGESGTLSFAPNMTERFIEVETRGDDVDEPDETFSVEIGNAVGATLLDNTGIGTIADDDDPPPPPLPALSIADAVAVEGETVRFRVTLDRASAQAVAVDYRTHQGTAITGGDFTGISGTLKFAPNATERFIEVRTLDDADDEASEKFTVQLSNPAGATLLGNIGIGTIMDGDDPPPLPALSIADAVAAEGETVRFRATLSAASAQAVTVDYRTHQGTATVGGDFTGESGTLSFAPGATERFIEVRTLDDADDEASEKFTVELSNPAGATLLGDIGIGTIMDDDDPPPLPALSIADAAAAEGETARFRVTLSAASGQAVTVDYRSHQGTAATGDDFTGESGTWSFAPNTTEQFIEVRTREDDVDEPDETFSVELSNPAGATLLDNIGIGTIVDDDDPPPPPPLPALSVADAAAAEGETARFRVTLSAASARAVTVDYRTRQGTAISGDDYTGKSGTLSFAPNTTERFIEVQTREDDADEPDETFSVELSNPAGAMLLGDIGIGTIVDDDGPPPAPLPALSIADAAAEEGEIVRFRVTLSTASAQAVTVDYRTRQGTAAAGDDFTGKSGTLGFAPNMTERFIEVETREDDVDEPDETFSVELSNPAGATVHDVTGIGTIADDDEPRHVETVVRALLPEFGRAVAFNAVHCRMDRAFSGVARSGPQHAARPSLSLPASAGGRTGAAGGPSLEQALDGASFLLPLTAGDVAASGLATWGCGEYSDLSRSGGGPAWDGDISTVQIGIDARFRSDMLAGVALSRSRGTFDHDGGVGSGRAGGSYELRLTGVHPYWGAALSSGLEIWTALGQARGELEVSDDTAGTSVSSPATLVSGTVGVNGRLLAGGGTALALKGEWGLARLDVAGAAADSRMAADMNRLRLAAEASHETLIPDVGLLTPRAELGLRHDGGDGETGAGLEVGAGLRYRNIEQGWNTEVHGRWLAAQGALPEERGLAARFRYDPETLGVGPQLSLGGSWGESASGVHRVWQAGAADPARHGPLAESLDAEVAYGFTAFGGRGALTPFGTIRLGGDRERVYRLGSRVALGSAATVSLEAERAHRAGEADHAVMLRGAARF